MTSMTRIVIPSAQPPKYPETPPTSVPSVALKATADNPMSSERHAAYVVIRDVGIGELDHRARPHGWVDEPSEGIISLYGLTYQSMAEALRTRNPQAANRALIMADSVFKNTSIRFSPPAESGN